MRTSELREIEKQRAAEREQQPRVVRRDREQGWNPRSLRGEIEAEFREHGARVFQETKR